MNKVYKTIYKEDVGWVTVSELASSRGKPSSSRRLAKILSGIALVASSLLLTQAQADALIQANTCADDGQWFEFGRSQAIK